MRASDGSGSRSTSDTSGSGKLIDVGAAARASVREQVARRIATNVASIEAVPEDLLNGVDRDWAFAWARKGYDVYACRDQDGAWYLWLESRCVKLGAAPSSRAPRPGKQQRH